MTQKFYTRLTEIGQAKYANAKGVGSQIEFTQLAVGDANGQELTPEQVQDQESMVNEVRVGQINQVYKDVDNPNWLVMEQVLPPDIGGWTIREVGIYDTDGDLVAYGNYPETYKPILAEGSSRTSTVRFVLMVSDTSVVTLKVDPSVVLATREYSDAGDEALKAELEQAIANAGYQFANYDAERIYTTGEVTRGSDGSFYEFYDRDQAGTVQGIDPTNAVNRPHIWMTWDGVRPGTTIEWRGETKPEGYIENDGAAISRGAYRRIFAAHGTTYGNGDGSLTFNLPDDRGEFKRGWDHGRGVDAWNNRPFGSHQSDAFQGHAHEVTAEADEDNNESTPRFDQNLGAKGNNKPGGGLYAFAKKIIEDNHGQPRTADETRPRNYAVLFLTKI